MFIGVSAHTCMSICVYTVFLKKGEKPYVQDILLLIPTYLSLIKGEKRLMDVDSWKDRKQCKKSCTGDETIL
jgi:hypothetical protein